jgi:malonate decarboxylase acyl carrier protein
MIDTLEFRFAGDEPLARRAHAGVVASGNCEVLLEPHDERYARVTVRTSVRGFERTWEAVLARVFERHPVAAAVEINDFGATPAVVALRLEQALEATR